MSGTTDLARVNVWGSVCESMSLPVGVCVCVIVSDVDNKTLSNRDLTMSAVLRGHSVSRRLTV